MTRLTPLRLKKDRREDVFVLLKWRRGRVYIIIVEKI